jgi:ferredoxin
MIGVAAEATTAKGIAKSLTREELLAMLEQADRDGLVLQPQNTLAPIFVCCCCGCCCGVLTTAKKLERPADVFQTDFVAEVDAERCEVCGSCAARCQMDAIAPSDKTPVVEEGRCIGCGLCVTSCPTGAMKLRDLEGRRPPPENVRALYTQMYQERFGRAAAAVAVARHLLGKQI